MIAHMPSYAVLYSSQNAGKINLAIAVVGDTMAGAGIPEQVEHLGTITDAEQALRYVASVNRRVD